LQIAIADPPPRKLTGLVGQEMIRDDSLRLIEPPQAHLGKNDSLSWNSVRKDHIERRKPVARHEKQGVPEVEDFPHLSRGDPGAAHRMDLGDRVFRESGGNGLEIHAQ
jgi:hypothetical protein